MYRDGLEQWSHLINLLSDLDLISLNDVEGHTSRQFNLNVLSMKRIPHLVNIYIKKVFLAKILNLHF